MAARVKKIEEHKAESYAMLIVYSFKDRPSLLCAVNPDIMMEVMVPSLAKVAEFDETGVPWRNVMAFVDTRPRTTPSFTTQNYHAKGTSCIVGSSRNLDRQVITRQETDVRQLEDAYRALLERGADLIETDIPVSLGPLLYGRSRRRRRRQPIFV